MQSDLPFHVQADDLQDPQGRGRRVGGVCQHLRDPVLHPAPLRGGVALGHGGAQQEPRAGDRPGEDLQEHQALADLTHAERPEAVDRPADGDAGHQEVRHRGAGHAEANGRPDQERKDGVFERVVRGAAGERAGEYDGAHSQQAGEQSGGLGHPPFAPQPGPGAQRQQRGRNQQRAGRIAEPPGPPERAELRPRLDPAGAQARDADGGADRRAEQRTEHDEPERMAEPVERMAEPREPADQVRRDNGLERVARRDAGRDRQRFLRRRVGEERPGEDAGHRPGGMAVEQQRREGETGRRPHQRDLLRRERHREAELRGDDVDGGGDGNRHQR